MFKQSSKTVVSTPLTAASIATKPRVNQVVFDAKVILSIIQTECYRVSEEGILFGLVVGDTLEITNNIALPPEKPSTDDETEAQREAANKAFLEERDKFRNTVGEALRDVKMDGYAAGWYAISGPDPTQSWPTTKGVVETQLTAQKAQPHFVLVSYDPWRSLSGTLQLRAMRLTDEYLAYAAAGDFSQKGVHEAKLVGKPIYEDIPYSVHVPLLAQVFLYETNFPAKGMPRDGNSVMAEREHSGYMKRSVGEITTALDLLARDLGDCTGKSVRKRRDADKMDEKADEKRHSALLLSRGILSEVQNLEEKAVELVQSAALASMMQPKQQ